MIERLKKVIPISIIIFSFNEFELNLLDNVRFDKVYLGCKNIIQIIRDILSGGIDQSVTLEKQILGRKTQKKFKFCLLHF